MQKLIFIVDDDSLVRSSVSMLLKHVGHHVEVFASPDEVLNRVRIQKPNLFVLDMNFSLATSGKEGLELMKKIRIFCPHTPILLLTAWGSISLAVKGIKLGAFDFITKPWDNHHLLQSISTALELNEEIQNQAVSSQTRQELDTKYDFSKIIGNSQALLNVLNTVARVAKTNASVLITGESGTGKELIAEALHLNSNRNKQPFVKVNLGGLSTSLFESEMFGHKRGAFTDAIGDRIGRFEMANKGTIFLDEIGELDTMSQVKLLRVLQDHSFEKLGDSKPYKVDIRVISATNAPLEEMVKDKRFREDLFYRINLIHIHVPPLRERKEDIPLLVNYFANKMCAENGLKNSVFSQQALDKIQSLPLLGNIRELKNIVERSLIMSANDEVKADDIKTEQNVDTTNIDHNYHTTMNLDQVEEQKIRDVLKRNHGNITHSAAQLGISRAALYRRISKYGIDDII